MPIYEYQCGACGHKFEDFIQAGEDQDIRRCPQCGKPKVERLVSAFCTGGGGHERASSGGCGTSGGFR
ncbi:MAG TPA: zinc ribbon domain-containing protein [bacterium]|nr:zinc ribbon domain-containing protein [bacterium]